MYITINDVIGEKRIDLSYPIHSSREVAVINMFGNNVQYEIIKAHMAHSDSPPVNGKMISLALDLLESEYKNHFDFIIIICATLKHNQTYRS